jgi:hypothetical protein
VLGLFVVGLGLVLFLEQFGVDLDPVLRWWPAALILLGAIKVSQRQGRGFGVVLTAIGTVLLLDNLGWLAIDEWELLWPLFVIAVGVALAAGGLRSRRRRTAVAAGAAAAAGDDPVFHAAAVMGGVRRQITSREFIGGDVSAVMGGCEIDLRHASMPEGRPALLDTFAFWGGIEIKVPDDWEVVSQGNAVLGGFVNNARSLSGARRRLVVTGLAIMGGVEVKN